MDFFDFGCDYGFLEGKLRKRNRLLLKNDPVSTNFSRKLDNSLSTLNGN